MEIRQKKTYSKEERRRRNRRFNTVLYIIAGVLILTGVIIIISDTTLFFDKLFHPDNFQSIPVPTGAFSFITPQPGSSNGQNDQNGQNGQSGLDVPDITLAPGETATPYAGSTADSSAEPLNPNRPVYVYFPKYDITCPIDPVGYNRDGSMGTVRAHNRAAWLKTSGTPLTGGNIILAGHNKYSGRLGYFDVVKSKMKVNDIVIVKDAAGNMYYYAVVSIDTYSYDGVPYSVMESGGESRLTLITCLGDFDHSIGTSKHRVIAVCKPISFNSN